MKLETHKSVYENKVFDEWASGEGLNPYERLLIEGFLDPAARTLEIGAGGGRILFAMRSMGFTDLTGYDFVPKMVEQAKQREPIGTIRFEVADARRLRDPDGSFAQLLYLQQIICFIEDARGREDALHEAFRVLAPGGKALFSFLSLRARTGDWFYAPFLWHLRLLRWMRGVPRDLSYLPWLRYGSKLNFSALLDRPPYVYWFRESEIGELLKSVGFKIRCVATEFPSAKGLLLNTMEEIERAPMRGAMYFACAK